MTRKIRAKDVQVNYKQFLTNDIFIYHVDK